MGKTGNSTPMISPELLSYTESFKFPFVEDVSLYDMVAKIGQGTFGVVYMARCKRTAKLVALKHILMEHEKEGFPITALREIKMLQKLKHENITELLEIVTNKRQSLSATARDRFNFYLVFTFCAHDLAGLLSDTRLHIRLVHIKTMMYHILNGLHKLHTSNVLHRDMKTANVLISYDGVLKLADFGLARFMYKHEACYTYRVVTLWYRPPELLLGQRNYGPAIDIWGAGCIMAELWSRSPILQGETEQGQLQLISKLCGSISPSSWPGVDQLPFYKNINLPQNFSRHLRQSMNQLMVQGQQGMPANEAALTLLDNMLTLDPAKRPTAEEALDSNFFFETPKFEPNIQALIANLPSRFEFTSGIGAHAHRTVSGAGNNRGETPAERVGVQQPPAHQQPHHAGSKPHVHQTQQQQGHSAQHTSQPPPPQTNLARPYQMEPSPSSSSIFLSKRFCPKPSSTTHQAMGPMSQQGASSLLPTPPPRSQMGSRREPAPTTHLDMGYTPHSSHSGGGGPSSSHRRQQPQQQYLPPHKRPFQR